MKWLAGVQFIHLNYYTNIRRLWQFFSSYPSYSFSLPFEWQMWTEYSVHDSDTSHMYGSFVVYKLSINVT